MGRPSSYSEEIAEKIFDRLIQGESLRRICRDDSMPSYSSVMRWQNSSVDFESKCARARILQADLMDDLILEEAEKCDETNFQAAKVRISAYQWRASKLAPKKYGDRMQHTGEDGGPINFVVTRAGSKEK